MCCCALLCLRCHKRGWILADDSFWILLHPPANHSWPCFASLRKCSMFSCLFVATFSCPNFHEDPCLFFGLSLISTQAVCIQLLTCHLFMPYLSFSYCFINYATLLVAPLSIEWPTLGWIFQAKHMNLHIGSWTIQPDQMPTLNPLLLMILYVLSATSRYILVTGSQNSRFQHLDLSVSSQSWSMSSFLYSLLLKAFLPTCVFQTHVLAL